MVEKSDRTMWPGLLAADIEAVLAHMLDDIAVADRGARQRQVQALQIALEAEIGHDGGDHAAAREPAATAASSGDQRHDLVAIDDAALLVGDDDAVGVAIERDADIGAHFAHLGAHRLRRGRAAFQVDVEAVGLDADGDDLGAQLPQRRGRDLVGARHWRNR